MGVCPRVTGRTGLSGPPDRTVLRSALSVALEPPEGLFREKRSCPRQQGGPPARGTSLLAGLGPVASFTSVTRVGTGGGGGGESSHRRAPSLG